MRRKRRKKANMKREGQVDKDTSGRASGQREGKGRAEKLRTIEKSSRGKE